MTETAKQGTTKAPAQTAEAGPAATESAAPQGEAEQETAAGPAQDALAQEGTAEAAESDTPDLDETKRKFREALERKHQAHSEGQGKGNRDGGKINGAHGPAASRRNFRRKSG
jgi:hypothetical protein